MHDAKKHDTHTHTHNLKTKCTDTHMYKQCS